METNTNYPRYKMLLESLNFDENEVEKYFNILTKDLRDESFSLTQKRDEEIEKLYQDYERVYNSFNEIKTESLKRYLKTFEEINEEFNKDIANLKSEYLNKTNVLLDSIEHERTFEQKIKCQILLEYYQAKKPIQDKIDEINKKLNVEYEEHSKIIFDAKETILKNEEFYLNADYHINELNGMINFLNELSSFNNDLNSVSSLEDFSSCERKIIIYLDYLKEEKEKNKNIFEYINKFDLVKNSVSKINDEILDRKIILDNELYDCLKELDNKINALEKNLNSINLEYNLKIEKETDDKRIKELNEKKNSLIKITNNKINSLKAEKSIEKNLLNKELSIIDSFNNSLNKTSENVFDSYKDAITTNEQIIEKTYDNLIGLLTDELNNLNELKEDSLNSREIIHYFNKRYQNLEITKKTETLSIFRDFIVNNVKENRELDIYAFEILTTEELIALKKIDLKRKYLTIDLDLEIKEIKYDYEIKEISELKNVNISMKNSINSLELLKKDFEIDIKIKKKELKNRIQFLDYEKSLDLLSTDYMIAYKRLNNIENIIKVKKDFDLKKSDIDTTLELENIVELSLLDAITKKKEFNYLMEKYNNDLDNILSDKEQKLRYMNNVLEIERNEFDETNKTLENISLDLRQIVISKIVNKKNDANKIIDILKREYLKDQKYLINFNENNQQALCEIDDKVAIIKNNYFKIVEYINSLEIDNVQTSEVIKNIRKSHNYLYKKLNLILLSFRLSNLELKNINIKNHLKVFLRKLNNLKNSKQLSILKNNIIDFINEDYSLLMTNFSKELTKIKTLSDREIIKLKNKCHKDHLDDIAHIAIQNSLEQENNFRTLDDIKASKNIVKKEYEKKIYEYKESYINTIDLIKKEYEAKYNHIMNLKNDIIETNTNLDQTLDNKITKSSIDIKNSSINYKKDLLDFSDNSKSLCEEKINELEKDLKKRKENIASLEQRYNKINQDYRDKKAIEAKNAFKETTDLNSFNITYIENEIKTRIDNKNDYLNKLKEKAISFKKDYSNLTKELENEYNDRKINNTMDYSTKYDEFEKNIISFYSDIEKPIEELNSEVTSTIIDSINKADRLEELLSDRINKSLNDINDRIDNNMTIISSDSSKKGD